ncbi:cytochrome P450 [Kitasatospora viridis]|uniref:Pentalenene oxygenase n=1 Tax=Kitasatospora viridis TaxID=281105 RepID=A0A561T7C2_9ACTN|nr:cytochrome P450 [Kitasatospora viridis]TWF83013.1 pentalenene oxygenase [Kitasatospora viridis]
MPTTYTAATAPGALPLLGHAVAFARRPLEFFAALPAHGDLVRIRLGPRDAHVVCHPDLVHQVLTQDRVFDKGGPFFDKLREVIGDGLASCPAHEHRRQRRMLQPAFHRDRLPGYAALMAEEIAAATADWRPAAEVDVPATMYRITTAATLRCLFSAHDQAGSLAVHESMELITKGVATRVLLPVPGLDRLPTPGNLRFRRAQQDLRRMTQRVITDYRARAGDRDDLFSMLLAARDEDGRGLTDDEIHDQAVTFLLGGMETTAALLAWAWYLIATHPAVRAELHAELDRVLGGRPAAYADLPELPVTGRIVDETLRLYPPGWMFTRSTTAATELGGHRLPAGAIVVYSPLVLHRDAGLFPRPLEFDPGRWTAKDRRGNDTSFIPFAAGARRCIGDGFAVTEATLVLASVAARWQLDPLPGQRIRPALNASLTPRAYTARLSRRVPSDQSSTITAPNR